MQAVVNAADVDAIEAVDIVGRGIQHIADMGDARIVDKRIEALWAKRG